MARAKTGTVGSSQTRRVGAQWLVVAVPGLAAVAMLAVMLFGWVQTRRSADLLLRGEGDLWLQRLNQQLREARTFPGIDSLRQLLEANADDGLTYLALVRLDGTVVAETGLTPPGLAASVQAPPGVSTPVENLVWVHSVPLPGRSLRGGPPPGGPPPFGGPPPGAPPPFGGPGAQLPPDAAGTTSLFIVFEPRLVGQLAFAARANAFTGVVGALGLLAFSLFASRLMRARDDMVRRLEHERRLASLGTMSGVVAHELRNPLASLKGHAQLLQEQLSDPPQRAQAQRVVNAAWRLERLITSLLELVRTGALNRTEVVPADVVRSALAAFEPGRLRVEVTAAPARWSLDAVRFQQVVTNLVDNALQASPEGTVVDVRLASEGRLLVLEVRDSGPGVPRDERERIFEPFVTTKTTGIGLGLALARQVVALHGGKLFVVDAPGGGACFRAEVPGDAP